MFSVSYDLLQVSYRVVQAPYKLFWQMHLQPWECQRWFEKWAKANEKNCNIMFQIRIHSSALVCLEFAAFFLNYSFTDRADRRSLFAYVKAIYVHAFECMLVLHACAAMHMWYVSAHPQREKIWKNHSLLDSWGFILLCVHSSSVCARHGVIQCKLPHHVHWTKSRWSYIHSNIESLSYIHRQDHTFVHIFWICPSLNSYWVSIFSILSDEFKEMELCSLIFLSDSIKLSVLIQFILLFFDCSRCNTGNHNCQPHIHCGLRIY